MPQIALFRGENNNKKWREPVGTICMGRYGTPQMGSSLCLILDGKREDLNVDFVLSIESFEA
jgi:hypothetical protein